MRWLTIATVLTVALGGCNSQPYRTAERLERGLVIVLTGIEGRSAINEDIMKGLDAGGVNWAIELNDWTAPLGPFYNLRAEVHNRRKTQALARRIARYRWDYPRRPVVLIGQSGGGAMAVWTAEALLAGQEIEGIVLLAAALSPDYHLEFALERTKRGIVSFYSSRDWMFLGLGTTIYGTMDGEHTASAGQVGFAMPKDKPSQQGYEKLFQIPWKPEMASLGHSGIHLTSGASLYVSTYIVPFVLSEEWSEEFVDRVADGKDAEPAEKASEQSGEPPAATTQPASAPASRPAETQPASRPVGDGAAAKDLSTSRPTEVDAKRANSGMEK